MDRTQPPRLRARQPPAVHRHHRLLPAAPRGGRPPGTRGIDADGAIDTFITHVNTHHDHTGLHPIPDEVVRPHRLRKTMCVITAQEPDGEIALGIQLKHAARRILANRTTHHYAQPDPAWAAEFDDHLATAAARKLTSLLTARAQGHDVAVGPGAPRLHADLDRVTHHLRDTDPLLQALHADDRTAVELLRREFPDLHLGTLNHCLWQPATAECQNALPPDQRSQAPLIGACHPARCRNSAVTDQHAPIWLAEHADLTATLRDKRLAPARRAALQARLDDVETITHALAKDT